MSTYFPAGLTPLGVLAIPTPLFLPQVPVILPNLAALDVYVPPVQTPNVSPTAQHSGNRVPALFGSPQTVISGFEPGNEVSSTVYLSSEANDAPPASGGTGSPPPPAGSNGSDGSGSGKPKKPNIIERAVGRIVDFFTLTFAPTSDLTLLIEKHESSNRLWRTLHNLYHSQGIKRFTEEHVTQLISKMEESDLACSLVKDLAEHRPHLFTKDHVTQLIPLMDKKAAASDSVNHLIDWATYMDRADFIKLHPDLLTEQHVTQLFEHLKEWEEEETKTSGPRRYKRGNLLSSHLNYAEALVAVSHRRPQLFTKQHVSQLIDRTQIKHYESYRDYVRDKTSVETLTGLIARPDLLTSDVIAKLMEYARSNLKIYDFFVELCKEHPELIPAELLANQHFSNKLLEYINEEAQSYLVPMLLRKIPVEQLDEYHRRSGGESLVFILLQNGQIQLAMKDFKHFLKSHLSNRDLYGARTFFMKFTTVLANVDGTPPHEKVRILVQALSDIASNIQDGDKPWFEIELLSLQAEVFSQQPEFYEQAAKIYHGIADRYLEWVERTESGRNVFRLDAAIWMTIDEARTYEKMLSMPGNNPDEQTRILRETANAYKKISEIFTILLNSNDRALPFLAERRESAYRRAVRYLDAILSAVQPGQNESLRASIQDEKLQIEQLLGQPYKYKNSFGEFPEELIQIAQLESLGNFESASEQRRVLQQARRLYGSTHRYPKK